MWGCVGMLTSQSVHAQDPFSSMEPGLTHEQILVTLPVYVTSIIATAIFTWTIAQYDRKRDKKLDRTQQMLDEMARRLKEIEQYKPNE